MPLVDLLNALLQAGQNGLLPTPNTLHLGCSYHLHSSHCFHSTWGAVMLKKKSVFDLTYNGLSQLQLHLIQTQAIALLLVLALVVCSRFHQEWILPSNTWSSRSRPSHTSQLSPSLCCLLKVPMKYDYFYTNIAIHEYCPWYSTDMNIYLSPFNNKWIQPNFHPLCGTNTRVHDYSQSSTPSLAQTCNYKMNAVRTEYSYTWMLHYRTTKGDQMHVTVTASLPW